MSSGLLKPSVSEVATEIKVSWVGKDSPYHYLYTLLQEDDWPLEFRSSENNRDDQCFVCLTDPFHKSSFDQVTRKFSDFLLSDDGAALFDEESTTSLTEFEYRNTIQGFLDELKNSIAKK